jgi:hypothetical protein
MSNIGRHGILSRDARLASEETRSTESVEHEESVARPATGGLARMENAMNYFKRYLERGGVHPQNEGDEI